MTVQLKVVPPTLEVRAILVVCPEQIVCELGVAVATGIGFTVIITVIGVPTHPFAVGVIVYVAVPVVGPVQVSVCDMGVPEPLEAPVTPDWITVQLKVVPGTFEVKAMFVVCPEQIV